MYHNFFNKVFKEFLDKNSFLIVNSRIKNYTISSYDFANISNILPNEKILLKNMLLNDSKNFNEIRNVLFNQKIKNNLTSVYCLIFNECVNINNEPQQRNLICSALKKYLSNILEEINSQLLITLEDKCSNSPNYNISQKLKRNKKDLKITIQLLFLALIYMLNKYQNIIDNTHNNHVIKGINIKDLKTTKIREELYLILILQQNLYWIEILLDCLFAIFQNLKNNKFRILINADNEFNNIEEDFKLSCFNCFLPLLCLIKKYATLKSCDNLTHTSIVDYLFNVNSFCNIIRNNNGIFPLKINEIDRVMIKLFECFIYEFLYDIDSLWKYLDYLSFPKKNKSFFDDNSQILYGFGIYLCNFVKTIAFIRDDNMTKIDFFNFYIFSYNLITNYFSRLNSHLYNLFTDLYNSIKNNFIESSNINLNYLQYLSNSLNDMIFHFMVFSFYNDSLKDIYSYNEILYNALISHCFLKTIIPIYSLTIKGNIENILIEILYLLIGNVTKYKIVLPLKCHFHKELLTHNFLLILDYFLNIYEKQLTLFIKEKINNNNINMKILNLQSKFIKTLSCLFDHYNCINFIYSNHILFMFNKILNNSGFIKSNNLDNIILRYIPNDKNSLNYKDINLNIISFKNNEQSIIPRIDNNIKLSEPIKDINFNCNFGIFQNENTFYDNEIDEYVGYPLDNNFDINTIKLMSQIELDEFDFNIIDEKKYLLKNNMMNKNNNKSYSIILANNGEFIEIIGIDKNLKENILKIMENIQYTDKFIFKLIQDKVINNNNRNIKVSQSFYSNLKYYDLSFKMNYFEYQNQIKKLLA